MAEQKGTRIGDMPDGSSLALPEPEGQQFIDLMRKASTGDKKAGREAMAILRRSPETLAMVDGLMQTLEQRWLEHVTKDEVSHYVLERRLAAMRDDLAPQTGLERLLAERIVLCWLALDLAERSALAAAEESASTEELEFMDRRLERAQRRYLAAIRALAQVRRLALPSIGQLNVGQNQVNVAAPSADLSGGGGPDAGG